MLFESELVQTSARDLGIFPRIVVKGATRVICHVDGLLLSRILQSGVQSTQRDVIQFYSIVLRYLDVCQDFV